MKKVLISMLTLIFIVSMITTVYAATGTITMSASSDSVIKGKTFTVTIAAAGDNNVTGIKGNLSYDSNKLSLENKGASNGFQEVGTGNELNAGIISTEGITLAKSVTTHTLTFKVLDTAAEGETEISFTDVELAFLNDSQEQIDATANNDSVTVTIKADDTTAGNQEDTSKEETEKEDSTGTEEKEETPSNTTTDSSNKSTGSSSDKKNNTTKKTTTKLPQTGIENAGVIALVSLVIFSIVSFISYKNYKNI